MKTFTSSKILSFFLIIVLISLSLTACIPQQSATIQSLISPTAEFLPTQQDTQIPTAQPTATSTPLPISTSTPEPVANLHDISTWPAEMQEYFKRPPEEWNNPIKQYASDVEFHRFVLQARRDFLTANGVGDADSMNKDALLLEYLKWGNENNQILVLTPIELRSWYADPENIGVAYKHILPNNSGVQFFEGLFVNTNIQDNNTNFQSLYESRINKSFSIKIFGEEINVPRANYGGVGGDLINLFKLPGINTDEGVGLLVHYINNSERHCYIPLATHFEDLSVKASDFVYLSAGNGNPAQIGTTSADFVMKGAHTGLLGSGDMLPVSINELLSAIGTKIFIRPDSDSLGLISGMFPWQLGLEGGQAFVFSAGNNHPNTIYPWSQP